MAATPLKWGILGTTFIADVMATAIQNSPQSLLQAVAGRDPQPVVTEGGSPFNGVPEHISVQAEGAMLLTTRCGWWSSRFARMRAWPSGRHPDRKTPARSWSY
nr:hypothetical protein [uncultured Albidiferax sp.]